MLSVRFTTEMVFTTLFLFHFIKKQIHYLNISFGYSIWLDIRS